MLCDLLQIGVGEKFQQIVHRRVSAPRVLERDQLVIEVARRLAGKPREIIVAVIGVETVYGQDTGNFRTLDALTTLAFDYPPRADFFRSELENFLLLAREQQLDVLSIRGSYAGALGIPQFMPSSYRTYAVDFNGNRRINLMSEAKDAIGSVANYLKGFGWNSDAPGVSQSAGAGKSLPHKRQVRAMPPIAVPALVSEEMCAGEITTPRTLAAWSESGIVPGVNLAEDQTARLIDFTVGESDEKLLMDPPAIRPGEQTTPAKPLVMSGHNKEFWLVFNNFEVIRRYNNSDFYAMSVFQLAEAIKQVRKANGHL